MKSIVKTVLLCLLCYSIFLLVHLPAAQVLGWVSLPKEVKISGVSQTLWSGKMDQLVYQGIPLQDISWQLDFLPLLWGNASMNIEAGNLRDAEQVSLKADLSLSASDTQSEGLQLYLPVNMVLGQLPIPLPVNASGRFKVNISQLDYQQQCVVLAGQGQWLNAQVAGTQGPIPLGTFNAELSCDKENVKVVIKPDNSFGLDATAHITPQGQFSIKGKFKPDNNLPQEVHQAAALFSRADAQGFYHIDW
ncbi:type II secretion system protein N [Neptunicella sp. SCSIO 80796]|uniref:type II secretion system protein N n=1 Tax=Neptunicella plasticusilytica TaxID=3117012 RepID=UPI003A4DEA42